MEEKGCGTIYTKGIYFRTLNIARHKQYARESADQCAFESLKKQREPPVTIL
jgi:hypothetical protein